MFVLTNLVYLVLNFSMKFKKSETIEPEFVSVSIYSDGACLGNPGPCSYGFVAYGNGQKRIYEESRFIKLNGTNNIAEYEGIKKSLIWAIKNHSKSKLIFLTDSRIVVSGLTKCWDKKSKQWNKKPEHIKNYIKEIKNLAKSYKTSIRWIPREKNVEADRLAGLALEGYKVKVYKKPVMYPGYRT